ncbi:MAG: ribose 5-phosphate isomerase B [Alphaproteobacteria bacterium]|nr:ribose 5-phosphate isomerase B [Alphaproteobacteria bacterium]
MQAKRIGIASDHAGCHFKEIIANYLKDTGYDVIDYGTFKSGVPVSYPDYAYLVAKGVHNHEVWRGILICGSGIGMSIAVNRYPFIRGALVYTPDLAVRARSHNDANVLVLGERAMDAPTAVACVDAFMKTEFEGGRHDARVRKLGEMPNVK